MNRHRVAVILGVLALAAVVGAVAYQAGVESGIERSAKIVAPPPGAAPYAYPYPYYAWHHHWFPFGPLFGILIFAFFVRAMFWGGGWHRHYRGGYGACGPCGGRHEHPGGAPAAQ